MNKKTILVGTDFSSRSDRAIRRASLIAREISATLFLVHVIDDDQPKITREALRAAARTILEEQRETFRRIDSLDCEVLIVEGDPFKGIIQAADDMKADLLVIGPHRRQALKDVFAGTTAERMIRESTRPVLMANGVPAGYYRHALFALDISPGSSDVIRATSELGLTLGDCRSVIHVFEAPAKGLMSRAMISEDGRKSYVAEEQESASRALSAVLADVSGQFRDRIVRHNNSTVADSIFDSAREISADLLVIGTRQRSGVARILLGSVAQEVLRMAPIDVLAIPPAQSE